MAFIKFGFHAGAGGGNLNGIDHYMKALDAAGIPFHIKCTDSMAGVFDGQEIANNSDVPHVLVYRTSTRDEYDYDVPNYKLSPKEAAIIHWQAHKKMIPPELDRKLVWIETINEIRPYSGWGPLDTPEDWDDPVPGFTGWADWLGNFAVETAMLMNAEGFKFAAFGYAGGNPEIDCWDQPGMLQYFKYCAAHPDKACVSLHEYSWETSDIWADEGYLVGRFEFLFEACDNHNIKRPNVLITEWGWAYDGVPNPSIAMQHILEVAELYAKYPEVLGVFIWYLGPEFGGIADKAQKLIVPLTELVLNTRFPDVEEEEPEENGMNELEEKLWKASLAIQKCRGINFNPAFGFPTEFRNLGYWPVHKEEPVVIDNKPYIIMAGEHALKEQPRILFAYPMPWGSGPVIKITDPNV